jgi:hypothetical protein
MGAGLDAAIEYKLTANGPWKLWDGGRDDKDYPKFDIFIPRGGLLYIMLGRLPGHHGIRFPRKGAPRDMSVELDRFLHNWADADTRARMSYLSFAELINASAIWDEIMRDAEGNPESAEITLRAHLQLARELLAGVTLPAPAVAVRLVYWFT